MPESSTTTTEILQSLVDSRVEKGQRRFCLFVNRQKPLASTMGIDRAAAQREVVKNLHMKGFYNATASRCLPDTFLERICFDMHGSQDPCRDVTDVAGNFLFSQWKALSKSSWTIPEWVLVLREEQRPHAQTG